MKLPPLDARLRLIATMTRPGRAVADVGTDHGKLIASGLPHEIANNQNVIDAYLGGEREKNAEN